MIEFSVRKSYISLSVSVCCSRFMLFLGLTGVWTILSGNNSGVCFFLDLFGLPVAKNIQTLKNHIWIIIYYVILPPGTVGSVKSSDFVFHGSLFFFSTPTELIQSGELFLVRFGIGVVSMTTYLVSNFFK